jgi:hypothetical protein
MGLEPHGDLCYVESGLYKIYTKQSNLCYRRRGHNRSESRRIRASIDHFIMYRVNSMALCTPSLVCKYTNYHLR